MKWPAQTKALTLLSHFGLLLLQCRQRKRNLAIQGKTPPNALSRDPFRQEGVISWFNNKAYWTSVKAANCETVGGSGQKRLKQRIVNGVE
jgi:hypothetical protein